MSNTVALNLRLPSELHQKLKALAEKDRRSLNSEIVLILEQATAEDSPDS